MSSRHVRAAIGAVRRAVPVLGIAAALVLPTLGPAAPARAEHQMAHDPTARIQIVVKSIHINDDHEPDGSGELELSMVLRKGPDREFGSLVAYGTKRFNADSGTTVAMDQVLPAENVPVLAGGYGSAETGLSVYSGEVYWFNTSMFEFDPLDNDFGGETHFFFDEGSGWGNGPHTAWSDDHDYMIEFEIRRTPLPNLVAHSIEIADAPGSTDKLVCPRVVNAGLGDAGPFDVAVRIDSSTPPGGKMRVLGLGSGKTALSCFQTDRLGPGREHALSLNVDEAREVPEMDEVSNQHLSQMYTARAGAAASGPLGAQTVNAIEESDPGTGPNPPPPPSSAAQADLVVSSIRVNGKNPSDKDACKAGKNDVTVVVKNGGAVAATSFAVRLVVDSDANEANEKTVGSLEVGKEQEVRFDDVRLKKGERTLTATADAKKTVAESKEDNNERKATVTCKDDDD